MSNDNLNITPVQGDSIDPETYTYIEREVKPNE